MNHIFPQPPVVKKKTLSSLLFPSEVRKLNNGYSQISKTLKLFTIDEYVFSFNHVPKDLAWNGLLFGEKTFT